MLRCVKISPFDSTGDLLLLILYNSTARSQVIKMGQDLLQAGHIAGLQSLPAYQAWYDDPVMFGSRLKILVRGSARASGPHAQSQRLMLFTSANSSASSDLHAVRMYGSDDVPRPALCDQDTRTSRRVALKLTMTSSCSAG